MKREPTVPRPRIRRAETEKKETARPFTGKGMGTGFSTVEAPWKAGLQAAKDALSKIEKVKPDLALGFVTSGYDLQAVAKGFSQGVGKDVPLVGAAVHGILFTEDTIIDKGVAIAAFKNDNLKFVTAVGRNLAQSLHKALEEAVIPVVDQLHTRRAEGFNYLTIFLLLDSYVNGDILVDDVAKILDQAEEGLKFFGGILDSSEISRETALVYNNEVIHGGVICIGIYSKTPLGMGYGHGLYPLVPKRATKVSGNIIYQFDGRPAFEVWKEYLMKKGVDEREISENLGHYLGKYQFGIPDPAVPKYPKVRLAMSVTREGGIRLAGDIPENSTVWLMEARKERMIETVGRAVFNAIEELEETPPFGAIVLEGFPRLLSLGKDFNDEIEAVQRKLGIPLIGFNTYGEILRPKPTQKWFHNSSLIISVLPE